MSLYAILTALVLGCVLGLGSFGLYVSFRILRFPDLTCEGSFPMGACVALVASNLGVPTVASLALGCAAGAMCGYLTGVCNTILRVPPIIASIIVLMSAYSVNLILMGKPVLALEGDDLFTAFEFGGKYGRELGVLLLMIGVVAVIGGGLGLFLKTEKGLALRLVGASPSLASMLGINGAQYTRWGLALANGLVGLSGAGFAHYQRFADVNLGFGILIALLASVFMAMGLEKIRRTYYTIGWQIICVILGTLLHRALVAGAYSLGFGAEYFNLLSAVLILAAIVLPAVRAETQQVFVRS